MTDQLTRNNHYVPRWYQRGFLADGQSRLHYLNLDPDVRTLPDGRKVPRGALHEWGPINCFVEEDLYTTQFGPIVNDDVERKLFGPMDDSASKAVRAFAGGDANEVHEYFEEFFEHMAAQKLRTPKGLDWIRSRYAPLDQVELMVEMQALRYMHCTMWAEGVREIVTADGSDVKFIVTDHPVTVFNAAIDPTSDRCISPGDPAVDALGTQTIFALDANTCLVLTHLEYAKEPGRADLTKPRTNARHLSGGMARTDTFLRGRSMNRDGVIAVNHLLKSRAKRFVAASNRAWLYPEDEFKGCWRDIAGFLLPKADLWQFGGETFVKYNDGRHAYWDEFGRTTKAHEFLAKSSLPKVSGGNDACGCGSGRKYKKCCQRLPVDDRPSWKVYGLRERNLMLCRAVRNILGLDNGATWEDVRRSLSDDQVRRIHRTFATLWSDDTDISSILPRPDPGIFRSVYFGFSDPRTVEATVLGWLTCFDEIVLVQPFVMHTRVKPGFSPVESPTSHKVQTLKNVMLLFMLEPFIRSGVVHFVPDPSEVDGHLGRHARAVLKDRTAGWNPPHGSLYERLDLGHDDFRRSMVTLPRAVQARWLRRRQPEMTDSMIEQMVDFMQREAAQDPLALLQELPSGDAGAQYQIMKGLSLESALYLAVLTGSVLHTDMEAYWEQLLKHAQAADAPSDTTWEPTATSLAAIRFPVEAHVDHVAKLMHQGVRSPILPVFRRLLAATENAGAGVSPVDLASQVASAKQKIEAAWAGPPHEERMAVKLHLHVPSSGFGRHEVQRLLVMFANATKFRPVPFALKLEFLD